MWPQYIHKNILSIVYTNEISYFKRSKVKMPRSNNGKGHKHQKIGVISYVLVKLIKFKGELLLGGDVGSFQYDRLKKPLSELKTLVKVSSPCLLWFQRDINNKHFLLKGQNLCDYFKVGAKGLHFEMS